MIREIIVVRVLPVIQSAPRTRGESHLMVRTFTVRQLPPHLHLGSALKFYESGEPVYLHCLTRLTVV